MPPLPFSTIAFYTLAAVLEIAGCFAFWAWLKLDRSPLWIVPGIIALALFAFVLTRVDAPAAGRAFAAYGGIYILASLAWMWLAEGVRPDGYDVAGATLAIIGAVVILMPGR